MNGQTPPAAGPGAALHPALAVLHSAAHAALIQATGAGDPRADVLRPIAQALDALVTPGGAEPQLAVDLARSEPGAE